MAVSPGKSPDPATNQPQLEITRRVQGAREYVDDFVESCFASGRNSELALQIVTPAKLKQMDPEFAFIDWHKPEADKQSTEGKRAELRATDADPQVRVAPGHAAA